MIALRSFIGRGRKRCALRLTISTTPARLRLRMSWSYTSMNGPSLDARTCGDGPRDAHRAKAQRLLDAHARPQSRTGA
eukprot:4230223-Prymnesium_polylepis.1